MYDPEKKTLVHLNDPETHELGPILKTYTDLDFLGEEMSDQVVV